MNVIECQLETNSSITPTLFSLVENSTFDELKETIKKITNSTCAKVMYKDDENDLVTVSSDLELNEAIQFALHNSRILSLQVVFSDIEDKPESEEVFIKSEEKEEKEEENKTEKVENKTEQVENKTEAVESLNPTPIVVPHNAFCNVCLSPIEGIRYKCANCPNYDLCSSCEDKNVQLDGSLHNPNHLFLKITRPICSGHRSTLPNFYSIPQANNPGQKPKNNNNNHNNNHNNQMIQMNKKYLERMEKFELKLQKLTQEFQTEKDKRKQFLLNAEMKKKKKEEAQAGRVEKLNHKLAENELKKQKLENRRNKLNSAKNQQQPQVVEEQKPAEEALQSEQPTPLPSLVLVENLEDNNAKTSLPEPLQPTQFFNIIFEESLDSLHNPADQTPEAKTKEIPQEEKKDDVPEEEQKDEIPEEHTKEHLEEDKKELDEIATEAADFHPIEIHTPVPSAESTPKQNSGSLPIPAHFLPLVDLLFEMGMTDPQANLLALQSANGSIERAIAILIGEEFVH